MKYFSRSFQQILRVLVFCSLFFAFTPSVRAESYFVDPALPLYQMSAQQKEMVSQLKLFDRTYQRLIDEAISVPSIWHYLAEDVFGSYRAMSCEGDAQGDAPFILRGMLASGICHLYEAQSLMEKGPHFQSQALMAYDAGLETLEKVIRIGKKNPNISYLPNYSTALRTNAERDAFFMHPLAGYETILVGVTEFPLASEAIFTRELITNVSLQKSLFYPFIALTDYQEYCRNWYQTCSSEEMFIRTRNTSFKQGSTDATARFFLSEFCPWGLGVYRTLRDAGLTRGMDWRILRPFAGEHPQIMSELSITKPFQIPNHILGEFNQIIGDGTAGFLDLKRGNPVQWAWVSQPATYTIKYISPMVHERVRTDDQFSEAMGIVKFVFGGPVDFAQDYVFGEMDKQMNRWFGSDSQTYYASWLLYHGNDKGFITEEFIKEGKSPGTTLFKKTAGAAFVALEEKMVADMYEGIDPRKVSLGTGYNGQPIPAIMFRGDVLGFQKIPAQEYARTLQSVRHFLLNPAAITRKSPGLPYDLSKNEGLGALRKNTYLKEQWANDPNQKELIRKNAWEQLPEPFGVRDYVNDFSPAYQGFNIELPKKEFEKWIEKLPKRGRIEKKMLYVQLWQKGLETEDRILINERINDSVFQLIVYNMHSPEGYNSYQGRNTTENRLRGMKGAQGAPEAFRYFGRSDHRGLPVANLALELTNRLQTRYRLVITQGKDGMKLAEYPLVIARGRGKDVVPVTGKLTSLDDGGVLLKVNLARSGDCMTPIPIKPVYTDIMLPHFILAANSLEGKNETDDAGVLHHIQNQRRGYDEVILGGTLRGFPLKTGYHKITVSVADRQFFMWAHVRHPYMPANIVCDFVVPPGKHEVVVTCPGVQPYRFTVSRPVPALSSEKLEQAFQSYQRTLAEYRKEPTQSHAGSVARRSADVAKYFYYCGREKEAHQYYLQARELGLKNTYGWSPQDLCFQAGDRDTLLQASLEDIADGYAGYDVRKAYAEHGRGHKEVKQKARDAARAYSELIRRWIALGGNADVARQLTRRMLECWSMAGFDPEDEDDFPPSYTGGIGLSFGPGE